MNLVSGKFAQIISMKIYHFFYKNKFTPKRGEH